MRQLRLLPDWHHVGAIALVWPEVRRVHRPLIPSYVDLVTLISGLGDVALIVRDARMRRSAARALGPLAHSNRLRFLELRSVRDIWIRDWAPIFARTADGRLIAVKAQYRPPYGATGLSRGDHEAGLELARLLGLPAREIDLVWDSCCSFHPSPATSLATPTARCDSSVRTTSRSRLTPELVDPAPATATPSRASSPPGSARVAASFESRAPRPSRELSKACRAP